MKTITIIEPSDVKYLRIDVGPRYWEDASIKFEDKWEDDIDYNEQKKGEKPKMPFAVYCEDCAKRCKGDSYRWQITIDLENIKVLDWPMGVEARVFYKVCDDGTYYLLDGDRNVLKEVNCYVPDMLSYIDDGYGDYIDMKIDSDGNLVGFPKEHMDNYIQKIIDTEGF